MEILEENLPDKKIIKVSGSISYREAQRFRKYLDKNLYPIPQAVLLDLHDLVEIDSSGIALLFMLNDQVKSEGSRMKICGLPEKIHTIFKKVKIDDLFEYD